MELHAYCVDALHPIVNVPEGTNNISILLELSRTRHGKPDAVIAFRIVVFVTTAGFGAASNRVAHVGTTMYVNASLAIALPTTVTTTTSARPTAPAGVTAVMLVGEITFKLVAATPLIVTLVVPSRSVPVIVINVPPKVEPVAGETDEIVARRYGATPQ